MAGQEVRYGEIPNPNKLMIIYDHLCPIDQFCWHLRFFSVPSVAGALCERGRWDDPVHRWRPQRSRFQDRDGRSDGMLRLDMTGFFKYIDVYWWSMIQWVGGKSWPKTMCSCSFSSVSNIRVSCKLSHHPILYDWCRTRNPGTKHWMVWHKK